MTRQSIFVEMETNFLNMSNTIGTTPDNFVNLSKPQDVLYP